MDPVRHSAVEISRESDNASMSAYDARLGGTTQIRKDSTELGSSFQEYLSGQVTNASEVMKGATTFQGYVTRHIALSATKKNKKILLCIQGPGNNII